MQFNTCFYRYHYSKPYTSLALGRHLFLKEKRGMRSGKRTLRALGHSQNRRKVLLVVFVVYQEAPKNDHKKLNNISLSVLATAGKYGRMD